MAAKKGGGPKPKTAAELKLEKARGSGPKTAREIALEKKRGVKKGGD